MSPSSEPISLPPISEFSPPFRLPVSPPPSSKRVKRDQSLEQQQQQQQQPYRRPYPYEQRSTPSPPPTPPTLLLPSHHTEEEGSSSAQVLAEKRRRNAGASARFRERRKLRERELQETCKILDRRVFALESALKQLDPHHSLLVSTRPCSLSPEPERSVSPGDATLNDRVSQLEYMMTLFQQQKKTTQEDP
ncbi:hypothetical protein BC941DRAFT_422113 [Chlamydoabsidia padenii]|nr:hypothetical protein BC941DRAFT_422113 [Chlamydoabsidia padenii]